MGIAVGVVVLLVMLPFEVSGCNFKKNRFYSVYCISHKRPRVPFSLNINNGGIKHKLMSEIT